MSRGDNKGCADTNVDNGKQKLPFVTKKFFKKLLKNPLTNGTKCAIIIKVSERESTPPPNKF